MSDLWDCFGVAEDSPEPSPFPIKRRREPGDESDSSSEDDGGDIGLENYIANAVSGVKTAGPSAFGLDGMTAQKRPKEPVTVKTPKSAADSNRVSHKNVPTTKPVSPKKLPTTKRASPKKHSPIAPQARAICWQAVELLNKIKCYECTVQSPSGEEAFQESPEPSEHDEEDEETSETSAAKGAIEDPTGVSNEETEEQGQEEDQSSEDKIMLVVECKKGQLKLRMGSHDEFGKMFDAFVSAARYKGWTESSETFRFEFDGEEIRRNDTPSSLGVEDDDKIDAFSRA